MGQLEKGVAPARGLGTMEGVYCSNLGTKMIEKLLDEGRAASILGGGRGQRMDTLGSIHEETRALQTETLSPPLIPGPE